MIFMKELYISKNLDGKIIQAKFYGETSLLDNYYDVTFSSIDYPIE